MTNTNHNNTSERVQPKDNLDSEVIERFYSMNSVEFGRYLANGGNHLLEIEYHLSRDHHPDYLNRVLETVNEELWFNWPKLREVRKGPLRRFYPNQE